MELDRNHDGGRRGHEVLDAMRKAEDQRRPGRAADRDAQGDSSKGSQFLGRAWSSGGPFANMDPCSGRLTLVCPVMDRTHSDATAALAQEATIAQFVMLTPFPGTVDSERLGRKRRGAVRTRSPEGRSTRYWRSAASRPRCSCCIVDEFGGIAGAHAGCLGSLHSLCSIWECSRCTLNFVSAGRFFFVSTLPPNVCRNGSLTDSALSAQRCWATLLRSLAGGFFRANRCPAWSFRTRRFQTVEIRELEMTVLRSFPLLR